MAEDYTLNQPIVDSLQDALDGALGAGRLRAGGQLAVTTADEVAAVVTAAHEQGGRVVLGESRPAALALDLGGLNAVADIDVESCTITAGAGATPTAIQAALNDAGLTLGGPWFAHPDGSLGAAIARGEALPLVISVSAVLPDGTRFNTPRSPRRATGPNPDALLVGTRGRFAVIVGATLRARPLQPTLRTAARGKASALLEALRLLLRGSVRVEGAWLRKVSRGQATLTVQVKTESIRVAVAQLLTDAGAKACPPDEDLPLSGPRPRWLGWRALAPITAGQGKRGAFIGPFDLHGGWARVPGESDGADPRLEALRSAIDPLQTLRIVE